MKSILLFFGALTIEKKSLLLTFTPILTVLLNAQAMLLGLALLVFIDLWTGVRKSLHAKGVSFNILKKEFWQVVSSKGMRDTWRKTYEYGIGIIVFAVFESLVFKVEPIQLLNQTMSITEIAIVTASVVEVYSIFENMEAVSGKNILKKIMSLLPSKLIALFKK